MRIQSIHAYEILDSRGNPTVRVRVRLKDGSEGVASVPSGASTGVHEALELRDGDKKRYGGKGVQKACRFVNKIMAPRIAGMAVEDQRVIDGLMCELDGTKHKSHFGANAILGISLACAHAGAASAKLPLYRYLRKIYSLHATPYRLPHPMMNILNGGRHADWSLDLQECMIVPGQKKFSDRLRCGAEVFHALYDILKKRGLTVGVGDEGGYAPRLKSNEEAFRLIGEAVQAAGYMYGKQVKVAIDAAASEFYNGKTGRYEMNVDKKKLSSDELGKLYRRWMKQYPLISLEDPFAEDDWDAWKKFTHQLSSPFPLPRGERIKVRGKGTMIVGDDLFVTNVERLKKGIEMGVGNAILIKVNQIGTLSETMDAIDLARKHDYRVILSHRSGETADTTIADLAVAVNADYIKTGSLSRSERVEKYNRLLEIESEVSL
ncbi:MAG: phosphopyruvate hydratase [Patescibacteria group bacterium]